MDRVITARGLVDRMPRGALGMLMLPLAAGAEVKARGLHHGRQCLQGQGPRFARSLLAGEERHDGEDRSDERIDWPPPYKEATEKYASQVRLTTASLAGRLRRRAALSAARSK